MKLVCKYMRHIVQTNYVSEIDSRLYILVFNKDGKSNNKARSRCCQSFARLIFRKEVGYLPQFIYFGHLQN